MPDAAPGPQLSVCVYCGSRDGVDPAFAQAARALGQGLAAAGMRLVYGAGDVGLMGRVARAAQAAGGQTLGVIPEHLLNREVGKTDLTALVVTETMHERKKAMFMSADAVVALPGGAGTLDELVEVLTWRQLGLHDKPIFLLDIEGFWAPFLMLLNHIIEKGFAEPSLCEPLIVVDGVDAALDRLAAVTPRLSRPGAPPHSPN